ncbi:T6SS immunity protein Tli3 family protein [Chimaeribacter arupi]|uniref:T6SS immunity protein Tli3 family protein n=1 Tax=Chimaeribacter arupi TaxID=2060066 RepID=UPI003CE54E49
MKVKGMALVMLTSLFAVSACTRPQTPPTQVIYRFDDHRYLELTGWFCEGALHYVDTARGIRSEITSQFYQAYSKKYVHPSERYIAVPWWDSTAFTVSKDYGKTWQTASFATNTYSVEPEGRGWSPSRENNLSFTVVNDQGFLLTRQGNLYMSSKPFDDPRVMPGGSGIDYLDVDGDPHHLRPGSAGPAWGLEYLAPKNIEYITASELANWQDLPTQVPEVKNYQGWDHMQCDPNKGLQ